MWAMAGGIAAAGCVGGVLAALLSEDKGFAFPRFVKITLPDDSKITTNVLRPGFLGLILIGAVAATLSWALYGPLANEVIIGTATASAGTATGVTLAALGGAALVGAGGSKWLSSQVDQALLRQTATVAAAKKPADAPTASAIATAAPSRALQAALKFEG